MALSEAAALNKDKRNHTSDMQHRHFATIAAIINDHRRDGDNESNFQADRMARHFADKLRATNPKFDRARFLAACGNKEA